MKYSNVQVRMPENLLDTTNEVVFQGQAYHLGATLPHTLQTGQGTISLISDGYTAQFELMDDANKVVGEAWFYCYHSHEGKFWAVMDEVELYEKEALK